jgi:hypothetical protein
MRGRHPKKEIEAALRRAEVKGFTAIDRRGHWGVIYCPGWGADRCKPFGVYSTPRNPGDHAKRIDKYVDKCPHWR